jgi:hypothetical protein
MISFPKHDRGKEHLDIDQPEKQFITPISYTKMACYYDAIYMKMNDYEKESVVFRQRRGQVPSPKNHQESQPKTEWKPKESSTIMRSTLKWTPCKCS